ncbi:MAG: hypothetical protein J6U25_00315 [Clostridia bacterium]|nr:hypothetical protein [Clostridia bacterium]
MQNKIEIEAVDNVYKNAHIALQSISDVLNITEDDKFKQELKDEYDGYERAIGEISSFMRERFIEPKDINPLKTAMLWTSINMNAMTDKSTSHLADMMLKGTITGISELMQLLSRDDGSFSIETRNLIKMLVDLEEGYEKNLKNFL